MGRDPTLAVHAVCYSQGRNEGGKGGTIPRAPNHCVGAEWLRGAPKGPNSVASTFFNTVHLLPKDLSFEHEGAELGFLTRAPSNLVTPLAAAHHAFIEQRWKV